MKNEIYQVKKLASISWYSKDSGLLHREDGPAIEWNNGSKEWYLNGKRHRTDGPAIEFANGDKEWWINGVRHRVNGPAVEWANGTKQWWLNDKLHRLDGPAVEFSMCSKQWYLNGNLHRENGPAVEQSDGTKIWYKNGKLHRLDGPAIEYADGRKEWAIDGELFTQNIFDIMTKKNDSLKTEENGIIYYNSCSNGLLHREDGPAIEYTNGDKEWWFNGELHRTDGPAIEQANGEKLWYINNKLHRADGPAIEYSNGDKQWYVNGKLHRTDGPAAEYANGRKEWWINGNLHRENGPAIIKSNGSQEWYLNGKLHREDGPAAKLSNGNEYYYLDGKKLSFENYKEEIINLAKKSSRKIAADVESFLSQNHIVSNEEIFSYNSLGQLHRINGPAIIKKNGDTEWWVNGKRHRVGAPAINYSNNYKAWWLDGQRHREDGPAVEYANGQKEWYVNGKLHRTDGPAVIHANGHKEWWVDGKLHRTDGPAIESVDGTKEWYLYGKHHRGDGPAIIKANGNKEWAINGVYHRENGPAIERANGDKEWWVNGKRHRENGPAIDLSSGKFKEWFLNDKLHRVDGPAIEYSNGVKEWHLEGVQYTESQFKEEVAKKYNQKININSDEIKKNNLLFTDKEFDKLFSTELKMKETPVTDFEKVIKDLMEISKILSKEESPSPVKSTTNIPTLTTKIDGTKCWRIDGLILHREDGPAIIYPDGTKEWYLNGKLHREDGPAIEFANGNKEWRINDFRHRVGGPAVEYSDGGKEWWFNGYLHRKDGPAVEYFNGSKEWYMNGQLHRTDGPAAEYADGFKKWYLNGKLHREDGPAVEHTNGYKEWFINGQRHRVDGPAIEHIDGQKEWYISGKRHRADGPAIEIPNGHVEYWDKGIKYSKEEFLKNHKMLSLSEIKKLAIGDKVSLNIGNVKKEAFIIEKDENLITYLLDAPYAGPQGLSSYGSTSAKAKANNLGLISSGYNYWTARPDSINTTITKLVSHARYNVPELPKETFKTIKVGDKIEIYPGASLDKHFATVVYKYGDNLILHMDSYELTHTSIPVEAADFIENNFDLSRKDKKYWRYHSGADGKIVAISKEPGLPMKSKMPASAPAPVPASMYNPVMSPDTKFKIYPLSFDGKIDHDMVEKFIAALADELKLIKEETLLDKKKENKNYAKMGEPIHTPKNVASVSPKLDRIDSIKFITPAPSFKDTFKSDLKDAGYRVASTQLTKAVKAALLAAFKNKGLENSKLSLIKELLETEFGSAFISSILGYSLTYMPSLKDDERIVKLASEFRVNGMAIAGNEIVSSVIKSALPAIMSESHKRIEVKTRVKEDDTITLNEEDVEVVSENGNLAYT